MLCTICREGETAAGTTTVTLTRGETTVVVKDVPAEVCENCGEPFVTEAASRRLLELAEEAARHNVEVEVVRYAA